MTAEDTETSGIDRRTLIKRSALVAGGALVWSSPVVSSLTSPALAADTVGTPNEKTCAVVLSAAVVGGNSGCVLVQTANQACCAALNAAVIIANPVERFHQTVLALGSSDCATSAYSATDCPGL